MHSNRPYLLKAFFDWIVDNQCTPYVIVDANYIGVEVPQEFVNDGQIVLRLGSGALPCDSVAVEQFRAVYEPLIHQWLQQTQDPKLFVECPITRNNETKWTCLRSALLMKFSSLELF